MNLGLGINIGGRAVGGFSPALLFAASEPGVWYDPSDFSTMFQESTGVTPVTAVGQSVGFLGDKSRGFLRGPELVTNGTFDANITGWTSGGGISWAAGRLSINATNETAFSPAFALPSGRTVVVTFDYTVLAGDGLFVHLRDSVSSKVDLDTLVSSGGSGTFSRIVRTTQALEKISFQKTGTTGAATVDNVSVRELPGNHATQSTAASRPTLGRVPVGGRRNLATFTEQFDNAAWSKLAATVTANAAVAPDGTTTADRIVEDNTTAAHGFQNLGIYSGVATGADTCNSIYCKADTRSRVVVGYTTSGGLVALNYVTVDLTNGNILSSLGAGGTAENVGDGWYRIKLNTVPMSASVGRLALNVLRNTDTAPASYLGDGTSGVLVWGAQGETASAVTAYQRVVTAFDVTQAGVADCYYLSFDGSDDFLVTGTITPGTDKVQVFAGVRKLSDAATGGVVEFSPTIAGNSGSFRITAPDGAAPTYAFRSRGNGSISIASTAGSFSAPSTNVLTGIGDIVADTSIIRVNGAQEATSATDQGTGNYLAYPLYIGRRGGTADPFNGQLYSLVTRFGANLTADQITQAERFVAGKTGVVI